MTEEKLRNAQRQLVANASAGMNCRHSFRIVQRKAACSCHWQCSLSTAIGTTSRATRFLDASGHQHVPAGVGFCGGPD